MDIHELLLKCSDHFEGDRRGSFREVSMGEGYMHDRQRQLQAARFFMLQDKRKKKREHWLGFEIDTIQGTGGK